MIQGDNVCLAVVTYCRQMQWSSLGSIISLDDSKSGYERVSVNGIES